MQTNTLICAFGYNQHFPFAMIVHWKINLHRKGKDVAETKQFVAMRMEEHYKDSPLEGVCVLFDFTGAGLAQLVNKPFYVYRQFFYYIKSKSS